MNLIGMLHLWFWLGQCAFLPEADFMLIQPNAGLVRENHVVKSLLSLLQPRAKCQTSYVVGLSDCLAVLRAVLLPTKFPQDLVYGRD